MPNHAEKNPTASSGPLVGLLDGQWTPHQEMRLSVDDTGFRQGATVVERLRTYRGEVFHVDSHLDRWQLSIEAVGISELPLRTAMPILIDELISRNGPFVRAEGDVGITLFATPGRPGTGRPTFGMHLNAIDHDTNQRRRQSGQHLVITDVAPPSVASWSRAIKVRSRLHYYLADQIAAAHHPGSVGVLVDPDGCVTETSIANLAIVEGGSVIALPRQRVLGGITQQVTETLARRHAIGWVRQTISVDRLRGAAEVLLMGTDGGIWFASAVDGKRIGKGKPGPVYRQLLELFDAETE